MEVTHLDFSGIMNSLSKPNKLIAFMTGILLVDYRRRDSQTYIFDYLDEFNRDSGAFIDFYLPGYVRLEDRYLYKGEWDDRYCFDYRRDRYYFQPELFEEECQKYKRIMGVEYNHFPILILIDVIREGVENYGDLDSSERLRLTHDPNPKYVVKGSPLIIKLEKLMGEDTTKVERLFLKIFEFARANTSMGSMQFHFRYRVLLGNHIPEIKQFLIDNIPGFALSIIKSLLQQQ